MLLFAGGVLHVHNFSMVSVQWVVKIITYMPNSYMCIDSSGALQMHFFDKPPRVTKGKWWSCTIKYTLLYLNEGYYLHCLIVPTFNPFQQIVSGSSSAKPESYT